jgi:hypothetical protein
MRVMDFSGARASAWNVSACGSNKLREYVEPVHLFDHLESAGTAPRRVGDVVGELINAAIDRTQIAELDMRHHYRKLVESSGRIFDLLHYTALTIALAMASSISVTRLGKCFLAASRKFVELFGHAVKRIRMDGV